MVIVNPKGVFKLSLGRSKYLIRTASISIFLIISISGFSQERNVSGRVTDSDSGLPLHGVNVIIQGTTLGTVTDKDGFYDIRVEEGIDTLIFSFIGYSTQKILTGNQGAIDVVLYANFSILDEVVITALNQEREKRSLGYAVQEVKSGDLRVARETNLNNSLAGKIAGLQVINGSAANFGQAAIRIRGVRGLEGEPPIYIMDGIVLTDPSSVNMDNVASVNVLKGANAAALYGNRARNGVVLITSKTPSRNDLTIEFNNTTQFEHVAVLPDYQDEYGGGYGLGFLTFEYDPTSHDPVYASSDGDLYISMVDDISWGPKFDGTPIRHWDSWYPNSPTFGEMRPWVANPGNIRDFYRTGIFVNNNLSIGKAGERYMINSSITNMQRRGVLPNTDQNRIYLNLSASVILSENWEVNTSVNYGWTSTFGNIQMDWENSLGANMSQWWHRQIDIKRLEDLWQLQDGTYTSWNILGPNGFGVPFTRAIFWDNPYTKQYMNTHERTQEDFYAKFSLAWEPLEELRLSVNAYRSSQNKFREGRIATGTVAESGYAQWTNNNVEDNLEGLITFNKYFSYKWSLDAMAGFNIRRSYGKSNHMATEGGLTVPDLFTIEASVDRPTVSDSYYDKEVRSVFGKIGMGYKEMLFIETTLRSDWTSALPRGNNNYVYPSISGSFVFSELLARNDFLSSGKVRMSFAQVGSDLPPHQIYPSYNPGFTYQQGSYAAPVMFSPDILTDENLQPAVTNAYETGIEIGLFGHRIFFDFSLYRYDNKNEIIPLALPPSAGSSATWINAAHTRSEGWEMTLGGSPVERPGFKWNVNLNLSQFRNEIFKLYPGVENLVIADINRPYATLLEVTANNKVGEQWGSIIGAGFIRDGDGHKVVDEEGYYKRSDPKILGHILPDLVGGIFSRTIYRNFEFSFTIDWQAGGVFYSMTKRNAALSGVGVETTGINDLGNPVRDSVKVDQNGGYLPVSGGLIPEGVFENGDQNNKRIEAYDHWTRNVRLIHENWLYGASYVKLRELRVAYVFPEKILRNIFLEKVRIALVANNPWLIYSAVPGMDPSELGTIETDDINSSPKGAWFEEGQFPGIRSVGFDIKLDF